MLTTSPAPQPPAHVKIYQHLINMHWPDNSTHSFIMVCVITAFFIILTMFASVLPTNNTAKDALFAMYA